MLLDLGVTGVRAHVVLEVKAAAEKNDQALYPPLPNRVVNVEVTQQYTIGRSVR
jgi:hypothetical protein